MAKWYKLFNELEEVSEQTSQINRLQDSSSRHQAPLFQPDDLEIGSILYVRLKGVGNYTKDKDDVRPMIVQGVWWDRSDQIKKIELLQLTTRPPTRTYPGEFLINCDAFRDKNTRLQTGSIFLLDNTANFFPLANNKKNIVLSKDVWPEILVRRMYSIMYNPHLSFGGEIYGKLKREGFIFSIPYNAIRDRHSFIPEIHAADKTPSLLLSGECVRTLQEFCVAHNSDMKNQGLLYYDFPDIKDWPDTFRTVAYPRWGYKQNTQNSLTDRSPQLP